jgi:hypothetical protein
MANDTSPGGPGMPPGVPNVVPVTPLVLPGVNYPSAVKPQKLTNSPRSRVISRGITAPAINPFSGLSTVQMFNIQSALTVRLTQLQANPATPGSATHLTTTNALLTLVNKRMASVQPQSPATQPAQVMLPSAPTKMGVRPSPLYQQPRQSR